MPDEKKKTKVDFIALFLEYAKMLDEEADECDETPVKKETIQDLERNTKKTREILPFYNNSDGHDRSIHLYYGNGSLESTHPSRVNENSRQNKPIATKGLVEDKRSKISSARNDESALKTLSDCAVASRNTLSPKDPVGMLNIRKNDQINTSIFGTPKISSPPERENSSYVKKIYDVPGDPQRKLRDNAKCEDHGPSYQKTECKLKPVPNSRSVNNRLQNKLSLTQKKSPRQSPHVPNGTSIQNDDMSKSFRDHPKKSHWKRIVSAQNTKAGTRLPRFDHSMTCQMKQNNKNKTKKIIQKKKMTRKKTKK